jgi:hypothetical protein
VGITTDLCRWSWWQVRCHEYLGHYIRTLAYAAVEQKVDFLSVMGATGMTMGSFLQPVKLQNRQESDLWTIRWGLEVLKIEHYAVNLLLGNGMAVRECLPSRQLEGCV